MMVLPLASIRCAPGGIATALAGPTARMRSPSITITPFSITPASSAARPAFMVRMRAPVMARVPRGLAASTLMPSAVRVTAGVALALLSSAGFGAAAKNSARCALWSSGPIDQNSVSPPRAQPI